MDRLQSDLKASVSSSMIIHIQDEDMTIKITLKWNSRKYDHPFLIGHPFREMTFIKIAAKKKSKSTRNFFCD